MRSEFRRLSATWLRALGLYRPVKKLLLIHFYRKSILNGLPGNLPSLLKFILFDKELTNFTYDITNTSELTGFIAESLGMSSELAQRYERELRHDNELRESLENLYRRRPDRNDKVGYGRRVGWYCIVRMTKPSLLVETGTHDGLGSSLLARALHRNGEEGHDGLLLTFDISEGSGWLLNPGLGGDYRAIIEDTRTSLDRYLNGKKVDFFIHDSDHTPEHEMFELETALEYAANGAVFISDNAHSTSVMKDFCTKHRLDFLFWKESPNHDAVGMRPVPHCPTLPQELWAGYIANCAIGQHRFR